MASPLTITLPRHHSPARSTLTLQNLKWACFHRCSSNFIKTRIPYILHGHTRITRGHYNKKSISPSLPTPLAHRMREASRIPTTNAKRVLIRGKKFAPFATNKSLQYFCLKCKNLLKLIFLGELRFEVKEARYRFLNKL